MNYIKFYGLEDTFCILDINSFKNISGSVDFVFDYVNNKHRIQFSDLSLFNKLLNSELSLDIVCDRADKNNKTVLAFVGFDSKRDKIWQISCNSCNEISEKTSRFFNKCTGCYLAKRGLVFDEFVIKAKKLYGDKFGYISSAFDKSAAKILCYSCLTFFVICPKKHLRGKCCPNCKPDIESKGERLVREYLERINEPFEKYKSFEGLRYKGPLWYDFFLNNRNKLIEVDGRHHREPVDYDGDLQKAIRKYEDTVIRDNIKNLYAEKSNIELLRISDNNLRNATNLIDQFLVS